MNARLNPERTNNLLLTVSLIIFLYGYFIFSFCVILVVDYTMDFLFFHGSYFNCFFDIENVLFPEWQTTNLNHRIRLA